MPIDGFAIQVIDAHLEAPAAGMSEQQLKGLRCHFNGLEGFLLRLITPVRQIPVAIIFKGASPGPGDAPVTHLVQGTGKESMGKDDAMAGMLRSRRQIERLVITSDETRVVGIVESAVEQCNDVI